MGTPLLRDRLPVGEIFVVVGGAAQAEIWNRHQGNRMRYRAEARPGETSPPAHQATEIGWAMAKALTLIEDPHTPAAVRRVWNDVVGVLKGELLRRGPPA